MNRPKMLLISLLTTGLVLSVTACSLGSKAPVANRAEAMKPGSTHGMPASNPGPDPAWFAQRFNRARGIGEAMRRNQFSLWDKESNSYAYFVGGLLYAEYQPLQHRLEIRADPLEAEGTECLWDAHGSLTVTPADAEARCLSLLDELDRHMARTGKFPPIGS